MFDSSKHQAGVDSTTSLGKQSPRQCGLPTEVREMPAFTNCRPDVAALIASAKRHNRNNGKAEMAPQPRELVDLDLRLRRSRFHRRRRSPAWRPAARRARPISLAASGRDGTGARDDGGGDSDGDGGGPEPPPPPPSRRPRRVHELERGGRP